MRKEDCQMFRKGQIWKNSNGGKFRIVTINNDWKEVHIESYTNDTDKVFKNLDLSQMAIIVKNQNYKLEL